MAKDPVSNDSRSTPIDSSPSAAEKKSEAHSETIHTNERVPGHSNYYEKNGLRTYGDDEDHEHEPPVKNELLKPVRKATILYCANADECAGRGGNG